MDEYVVKTTAGAVPRGLNYVRDWLDLDPEDTSQDAELNAISREANDWIERYTYRALTESTFKQVTASWPGDGRIPLLRSRTSSVTSVHHRAFNSDSLTAVSSGDYRLVQGISPYLEVINPTLPSSLGSGELVTIFVASSIDGNSALPTDLLDAFELLVVWLYEGPRTVNDFHPDAVPESVTKLLAPWRLLPWRGT